MERVDKVAKKMVGKVSGEVGKGLLSGLAGTIGMTAAQMIDMKLSGRSMSSTPAIAVEKVFKFEPSGKNKKQKKQHEQKLAQVVHWLYGTSWGISRGLLASAGITGWKATALQFSSVWGAGMIMLPSLKVAPPVKKWDTKEIVKDAMYHALYALVAGYVFDKINNVKH